MGYVIITEQFDYADEFDVYGFTVTKEKKAKRLLDEIEKIWKEKPQQVEMGFGTNEDIEFHSFEDFMNGVKIVPCSKKTAKYLIDSEICRNGSFGHTFMDQLLDYLNS